MGSVEEIQQVCRLCLVKDQVNIPIFDETSDIRQTFLKISACLPVKLSRDDNLPKKICDGCSYKLDMLYVFRNTSVESEKQLIQWLNQVGLSTPQLAKPEILVKQETFDPPNESGDISDTQNYLLQQQKLPYPQEFAFGEVSEEAAGTADLLPEEEGPSPKRARRAASLKKPPPQPVETDDEDLDAAMQITKAEDEDSEDADQPEYVEAPSTSADDQPGPSGVGKGAVEAPAMIELLKLLRRPFQDGVYGHLINLKHYNYDASLNKFCCKMCHDNTFETEAEAVKHAAEFHIEHFECETCKKSFEAYEYSLHMRTHRMTNTLECPLCSFTYSGNTPYSMKCHIDRKHYNKYNLRCKQCGKGFCSKQAYLDHQQEHILGNNRPVSCVVCARTFKSTQNLLAHQVQTHTVGFEGQLFKFQCNICFRILQSAKFFERHKATHAVNKAQRAPFLCEFCGKSCVTTSVLRIHQFVHFGEKPYSCDVCKKTFLSSDKLKLHKFIHSGEKPYMCTYCSKKFRTLEILKAHERIHTGEKPFSCKVCKKSFNQKSPLTIHMRGHTGERPYVCQKCESAFISRNLLNTHLKKCNEKAQVKKERGESDSESFSD